LSRQTYLDYLRQEFGVDAAGSVTDFVSRRDGRLLLADRIDLNALARRYGAPLEVAYCPLITEQVERMHAWADAARERTGYAGAFVYAYATKANFAEEVVRTALSAGAHYETSSAADVVIAHHLWRQGVLPADRYIFCNGSKEDFYIDAIVALRAAGNDHVVPILDDLDELEALIERCDEPLLLGVRARFDPDTVDPSHPGGDRFGLTPEEMLQAAARVAGTPHKIIVYHAMVGSQIENLDGWMARLEHSAEAYCRLRQQVPTLHAFNFGGGMPTSAYEIGFAFDYAGFWERLLTGMAQTCARFSVPQPDIIGEFGRYTVASHNVLLMEVGAVKERPGDEPAWYLVNGSMMVSLPDTLFVEGQQFVMLPLDNWDAPVRDVRLAGRRTCDTDDIFPRPAQPPLKLPSFERSDMQDRPYIFAVFGVGAYQQMIAGRGGAHHCLSPEMRRIIIEREGDALTVREVAPQSVGAIMGLLGYNRETLEPARPAVEQGRAAPNRTPAPALRLPAPALRTRRRAAPHLRPAAPPRDMRRALAS
jgi:arginine decarboxylase